MPGQEADAVLVVYSKREYNGLLILSFAEGVYTDNDNFFIRKAMIGNTEKRIYLISGVRFQVKNRPVNKMLHNDYFG